MLYTGEAGTGECLVQYWSLFSGTDFYLTESHTRSSSLFSTWVLEEGEAAAWDSEGASGDVKNRKHHLRKKGESSRSQFFATFYCCLIFKMFPS